jgi:hypothetical protein
MTLLLIVSKYEVHREPWEKNRRGGKEYHNGRNKDQWLT